MRTPVLVNANLEAPSVTHHYLGPRETAWPTVALFFGALALHLGLAAAALSGHFPVAPAVLLCAACAYAQFTVVHDSLHWCLSRRPWINESLGVAGALILFGPFEAFRRNHLHHHARTNDPLTDPDFWAAGESWPSVVFHCATMLQRHYYSFLFKLGRRDAVFARTLLTLALMAAVWASAAAVGQARALVLFWWLPAQLAVAALAFLFDYWPHRPHREIGRLRDTAALEARYLDPIFLEQNLHLVHHLYPTIPWYRYRSAFRELRPWLAASGGKLWSTADALRMLKPGPIRRARVGRTQ